MQEELPPRSGAADAGADAVPQTTSAAGPADAESEVLASWFALNCHESY